MKFKIIQVEKREFAKERGCGGINVKCHISQDEMIWNIVLNKWTVVKGNQITQ